MSPEESLLLAAVPVDPPRGPIDLALTAPLDWTRVVELALAHHLVPAMCRALSIASPGLVPPEILAGFRDYRHRLASQTDRLLSELTTLVGALDNLGIFVVPFKGPALGRQLFGAAAERTPGDLDLLVRRTDIARVRRLLFDRGYQDVDARAFGADLNDAQRRMYERYQCEYLFVHPVEDVLVEPHWDLCQRTLALDLDYDGMLARAVTVTLDGCDFRQLTPEDLLVALCIHGAKHHWERLAWVRDVAGVLARWPELDISRVMAAARHGGYARVLLMSLEVVRRCAGVQLPPSVATAIGCDAEVDALATEVMHALFWPKPEPRNDQIEPFRYRMRERRIDRLRYALRTWFTPRRRHLEVAPLPTSLAWAYYPIKLGTDYAITPLWQAGKRLKAM